MDPAAIIDEASFPTGTAPNTAPFHLPEIWHFRPPPLGDPSSAAAGGLGLRSPQFGHAAMGGQFGDFASGQTRDVPVGSEHGSGPIHNRNSHRKRRDSEEEESAKGVSASNNGGANANANCVSDGGDGKRVKGSGNRNEIGKGDVELSSGKPAEQQSAQPPPTEPAKQDYIHVRARRGQATDSHSLAERARREKISERMKTLQDLVPGCNKVIGKALVLDEIINYIQSLQRQVELLSMKLEAVNARLTPGIEVFPPKDLLSMKLEAVNARLTPGIEVFPPKDLDQQTFDTHGMPFASQAIREYSRRPSPEWLHMQVGGGLERTT